MSVQHEVDANVALMRAIALAETAADALAGVCTKDLHGAGLGELLVRLRGVQRTLDAVGAGLGARFAASTEWELLGARNAASWLHGQGNDAWSDSRSVFDRGRAIQDFPNVAQAWQAGEICAQHVDALARLVRRYPSLSGDLLAADEAIAAVARVCEPREFYQRLRQLCHEIDPDALQDGREGRGTGLFVSMLLDGFVRVDGMLDPVLGACFVAALEAGRRDVADPSSPPSAPRSIDDPRSIDQNAVVEQMPPHRDTRPRSERNLDGLRRILQAAGAASCDLALPVVSGERPTVNVLVPIDALIDPNAVEVGWLERFGLPTTMVSGAQARQLSCDASLRPLIMDSRGQLVAMLPKSRTIHPALRRAIFMRDHHCRFPGCRSRIDEVHHMHFHSHGGPTVMTNLIGLCWGHHHRVHESGWLLEGDPGGVVVFRSRHGRALLSNPPVPWVTTWAGGRSSRLPDESADSSAGAAALVSVG